MSSTIDDRVITYTANTSSAGCQPAGRRWPDLEWSFIELADRHGGKVAFYQIPPSSLPLYLDAGLEVFKLGEMARVFLPSFSLEGSTRADLRYALKRGERDGLRSEMIPRERVASVIDEIEGISDDWLIKYTGEREKRFSVAAFHRDYVLRNRSHCYDRMVKRWPLRP